MVLIDKAALLNKIAKEVHYDSEHSLEMYAKMLSLINDAPTVEAIPIYWILNHEKMPTSGKGHDAIMDMIESWRERREDGNNDRN